MPQKLMLIALASQKAVKLRNSCTLFTIYNQHFCSTALSL